MAFGLCPLTVCLFLSFVWANSLFLDLKVYLCEHEGGYGRTSCVSYTLLYI